MQGAFATVVWVVCGAGIVVAVLSLIGMDRVWDEFGKGEFVMDRDPAARGGATGAASPAARAEAEAEIRQMLEAKNARRLRRGERTVDLESELRRLTVPALDDDIRSEIRDLVLARNHRRARTGKPPLDVEAEIAREIASLREL